MLSPIPVHHAVHPHKATAKATAHMGKPSTPYGFLGIGIMGEACARNLLKLGHGVCVWNRNADKCSALVKEGAVRCETAAEVVARCDITFGMLSDPPAALSVALGPKGVLESISGKSYIDMSTVDCETSRKIGAAVTAAGGRFLEAPVSGSKQPAIDGQLVLLCAGDESLYKDAEEAFGVLGKKSFFLGETGAGAKMKLVVNMTMGTMLVALSEGVALAVASGLAPTDLLAVIDLGAIASPLTRMKGPGIAAGGPFPPAFPLKHQQKDLRLALALGDEHGQALPLAAAANAAFIAAKAAGHGDSDFAAVSTVVGKPAAARG